MLGYHDSPVCHARYPIRINAPLFFHAEARSVMPKPNRQHCSSTSKMKTSHTGESIQLNRRILVYFLQQHHKFPEPDMFAFDRRSGNGGVAMQLPRLHPPPPRVPASWWRREGGIISLRRGQIVARTLPPRQVLRKITLLRAKCIKSKPLLLRSRSRKEKTRRNNGRSSRIRKGRRYLYPPCARTTCQW